MMKIDQSEHVLEVACGTGALIPLALQLKVQKATYLATDLCENMIETAKKRMSEYLAKINVEEDLSMWMQKNNVAFEVVDG